MADRDNREAILGTPLARLLRNLAETSCNEGSDALYCRLMDCKSAIETLLLDRDLANKRIEKIEQELRATRAGAPATSPMCERKTNDIMARDGYEKTGYVLRKAGADICVSDGGAVAWFTQDQWNWLMFNRMHTTFDWPKPPVYEIDPAPGGGSKHGQT